MMWRHIYPIVLMVFLMVASDQALAVALAPSQGDWAYRRGDYKAAHQLWLAEAKDGNAEARYRLGGLYENGEGVDQSYLEAARWYREAALMGHAEAQYDLGVLYENGEGLSQDHTAALGWYLRAADQDHLLAQYTLGMI